MSDLARMSEELSEALFRVAELERRQRNMMRYAEIVEVDAAKGLVKVIDRGGGEGKDLTSPWLPWMEMGGPQDGGNATTWRPPRVGQRVTWMSPSGNLAEGMIMSGGFSNRAGAPSQDGAAHVETNGGSTVTMRPDGITHKADAIHHEATGGMVHKAARIDLNP